jgi:hypothetical protein
MQEQGDRYPMVISINTQGMAWGLSWISALRRAAVKPTGKKTV